VVQADTESEQSAVTSSPFFQVVRRGYDCTQVDAYIPELVAQPTPTFEQLGEEAATVLQKKAQEAPAAEGTAEPKAHPSPRPSASRL
jgi:hypothetical protein